MRSVVAVVLSYLHPRTLSPADHRGAAEQYRFNCHHKKQSLRANKNIDEATVRLLTTEVTGSSRPTIVVFYLPTTRASSWHTNVHSSNSQGSGSVYGPESYLWHGDHHYPPAKAKTRDKEGKPIDCSVGSLKVRDFFFYACLLTYRCLCSVLPYACL